MKREGNLSFRSVKKGPKGLTDAFYDCVEVDKTFWFVTDSYV